MNLLEAITAVIVAEPRLAEYFSRAELEAEIQQLIDRLLFAGLMSPRGGAPE